MSAVVQGLTKIRIPLRVGLAVMTFAAVFPVGLSAVGNAEGAKTAAFIGLPVVLLAALAWRGNQLVSGKKVQVRRVLRQKQVVTFAFSALLFSLFVSDWPRGAAIYASVALNQNRLEAAACEARLTVMVRPEWTRWYVCSCETGCGLFNMPPPWYLLQVYFGLVTTTQVEVNEAGDFSLYVDRTNPDGVVMRRCVYTNYGPGHGELSGP